MCLPADTSHTLLHKHEYATSYVLLDDTSMTSRDADGEWSAPPQRRMRKTGEIADRTDYYIKLFAHQVRNVSTTTFTTLAVVNTYAGQYRPAAKGGDGHHLLLENDWFTEHRLELSVGEVSEDIKFASPVLAIQVSKVSTEVFKQHSPKNMAGGWSFHEAEQAFQLCNSSNVDVRLVLLEVK